MTSPHSASPPRVYLLHGRDKRVGFGHPWAYSNEIRMDAAAKAIPPGALAQLVRVDGKFVATGTFNPKTLIAFRAFARDADTPIDRAFIAGRLRAALALRERLYAKPFYRLIHAEADGLPGLIVDRLGGTCVLQAGTAGIETLTPEILAALDEVLGPRAVVLANESPLRALEGLETYARLVSGELSGPVEVEESGLVFFADPLGGQKTGWFFDQRDNRAFVAHLARDAGSVLDLYSYVGGFAVAAAQGARRVLAVDSSAAALDLAKRAAAKNGVAGRCEFRKQDAFDALEALAAGPERFDIVVADPPPFARSKKDVPAALKGYRKLARLAAGLVAPGGFLFIASCSHNVTAEAFALEVAGGVSRAGREGRVLRATGAGPDHPVHPLLPETAYLKSLTLQLD
ncbi:MAG: class I SAM-dependent rRNA methyltransferase [Alphaproteobacteria bacterium]|nr:class I SAM-dependent rRNA methyltransferase [Alphaproteobacteria bacterium]MBM3951616.1 class I SAM-dependent rRNA methyltransferase [Rhodospirillales bacterium]